MKRALEVDLMRLLAGDLPPEREQALRDRLEREPELAAAYRRLERAWEGLTLPPPAPVPLGFSGRVVAHALTLRAAGVHGTPETNGAAGVVSWAAAPNWVRASCAAALLTGLLLGAGLGSRELRQERRLAASAGGGGVPALTESYWELVDTAGEPPAGAPALPSSSGGETRR